MLLEHSRGILMVNIFHISEPITLFFIWIIPVAPDHFRSTVFTLQINKEIKYSKLVVEETIFKISFEIEVFYLFRHFYSYFLICKKNFTAAEAHFL